jgi:hypothetical protein
MASKTPVYYVISPPLAGEEAEHPQSWLGRFVRHLDQPSENYVPHNFNTEKLISEHISNMFEDSDFNAFTESVENKTLKMKLTSLRTLNRESQDRRETRRNRKRRRHQKRQRKRGSQHMITIRLWQHERAFDALMAEPRIAEQTKHLVRSSRGEAYMIVGVKVVFDRRVMLVTDPTTGTSTTVPVPADEDVWDAIERLSSPVRLDILDSSGTLWLRDGSRVDVSHRFEGARIFALEYRSVTFAESHTRETSISPDSLSDLLINNNTQRPDDPETPSDKEEKLKIGGDGFEMPRNYVPVVRGPDIVLERIKWAGIFVGKGARRILLVFGRPHDSESDGSSDSDW